MLSGSAGQCISRAFLMALLEKWSVHTAFYLVTLPIWLLLYVSSVAFASHNRKEFEKWKINILEMLALAMAPFFLNNIFSLFFPTRSSKDVRLRHPFLVWWFFPSLSFLRLMIFLRKTEGTLWRKAFAHTRNMREYIGNNLQTNVITK